MYFNDEALKRRLDRLEKRRRSLTKSIAVTQLQIVELQKVYGEPGVDTREPLNEDLGDTRPIKTLKQVADD